MVHFHIADEYKASPAHSLWSPAALCWWEMYLISILQHRPSCFLLQQVVRLYC